MSIFPTHRRVKLDPVAAITLQCYQLLFIIIIIIIVVVVGHKVSCKIDTFSQIITTPVIDIRRDYVSA